MWRLCGVFLGPDERSLQQGSLGVPVLGPLLSTTCTRTKVGSIFTLRYVPWGNAQVAKNGSFECQHGAMECVVNTIEAVPSTTTRTSKTAACAYPNFALDRDTVQHIIFQVFTFLMN